LNVDGFPGSSPSFVTVAIALLAHDSLERAPAAGAASASAKRAGTASLLTPLPSAPAPRPFSPALPALYLRETCPLPTASTIRAQGTESTRKRRRQCAD